MKIQDIHYIDLGDKYGGRLGVRMPGGYAVFKSTMNFAYEKILAKWSNLDLYSAMDAKSIVGVKSWGGHNQWGFNQALGRCVKFFVINDMLPLPLEIARKRNGKPFKGGSLKYVLRGRNAKAAPAISIRHAAKVGSKSARDIQIAPPHQPLLHSPL